MVEVILGDCIEVMRGMAENSVDAVVTDPPYGLEFMEQEWDTFRPASAHADAKRRRADELDDPVKAKYLRHSVNEYVAGEPYQAWCHAWATEVLRVLKPGGHLLAFGGSRTHHRLMVAIEDAGFEIRDCLMWLYGSGFPKSLDVSKTIDKHLGIERQVIGIDYEWIKRVGAGHGNSLTYTDQCFGSVGPNGGKITAPASEAAARWQGWGTALKPAYEPIILARKPLSESNVAANVLKWGTGALNIGGCRVGTERTITRQHGHSGDHGIYGRDDRNLVRFNPPGRWPANVLLDKEAAAMLDAQSGGRRSRFFYVAKASRSERGEYNTHPTVKPIALMRYLIRLVTPPGGTVLDPFGGSGTTAIAAMREGRNPVLIERVPEYVDIAKRRIAEEQAKLAARLGGLFAEVPS